jgi:nucleotide-binding universal stress UspA family protein
METPLESASAVSVEAGTALSRIVCGIDGSPEADEAARQAVALAPPGGHVLLVSVVGAHIVESVVTVMPGAKAPLDRARRREAWAAIDRIRNAVDDVVEVIGTVRTGPAAAMLQAEADLFEADTIALGSHGHGRAAGVLLGSVTTRFIHKSDRSVLVVRAAPSGAFPRTIVAAVDGSGPSLVGLRTARRLAGRTGALLQVVHIADGSSAAPVPEDVEEVETDGTAAEGLIARATSSDLMVIGSHGLKGMHALSSVAETVAHRAPCSVLIVR